MSAERLDELCTKAGCMFMVNRKWLGGSAYRYSAMIHAPTGGPTRSPILAEGPSLKDAIASALREAIGKGWMQDES